jgi:serine/threonine protein kinase
MSDGFTLTINVQAITNAARRASANYSVDTGSTANGDVSPNSSPMRATSTLFTSSREQARTEAVEQLGAEVEAIQAEISRGDFSRSGELQHLSAEMQKSRAREEAAEQARKEAEELRQAEESARLEAEELFRKQAEEQARKEAEEQAMKEAEEQARLKAEQARKEAEEQARLKAEQARKEAEEQARKEAEEHALEMAEVRQKLEAEKLKAENLKATMLLGAKLNTWQVPSSAIIDMRKSLGGGSFGDVSLVTVKGGGERERGMLMAFKKIRTSCKAEQDHVKTVLREAQNLKEAKHENVIGLEGISIDNPERLGVLMEYAEQGTLRQVLDNTPKMDAAHQQLLIRGVLRGLAKLHSHLPNPILHGDLKATNVLIMADGTPKLADFGKASGAGFRTTTNISISISTHRGGGTAVYTAPELFTHHFEDVSDSDDDDAGRIGCSAPIYTMKCDLYSAGVLMWEVMTRKSPWIEEWQKWSQGGADQIRVQKKLANKVLRNEKRPEIPDNCNPLLRSIIERCWHPNPATRPAAQVVLDELQVEIDRATPASRLRKLHESNGVEEAWVQSTALIAVFDRASKTLLRSGSGAIVNRTGVVITCSHVMFRMQYDPTLHDIWIGVAKSEDQEAQWKYVATREQDSDPRLPPRGTKGEDIAVLRIKTCISTSKVQWDKSETVAHNVMWTVDVTKTAAIAGIPTEVSAVTGGAAGEPWLMPEPSLAIASTHAVKLGMEVFVIGYPAKGGTRITATKGVISGRGKGTGDGNEVLKIDATVNIANSGGPVVCAQTGELLGIVSEAATDRTNPRPQKGATAIECFQHAQKKAETEPLNHVRPISETARDMINAVEHGTCS